MNKKIIPRNLIREQEKLRIFKLDDVKKIPQRILSHINVKIKKIGQRAGLKIYIVNGYKIRHFIDFDFTMGGHGLRYRYIPLDEIWIDDSNKSEIQEIIAHEIYEYNLMKRGIDYNHAHEQASLIEFDIRNKKIILPVGHHRQITSWSCGPSALKIVLDFYQVNKNIKYLIKKTACTIEGTLHKGFKKALKGLDMKFFEKEDATITDIKRFIQSGIPVIVDYQAYHGGHFSVIIGYDKNKFLLSDPAYDKKCKWINEKNFVENWWEEDEPGKIVKKWMLVIYPKIKSD
ncbi:MAG: cysteine peptidase family C39 domain-containing protein [Nanoarchaeota archaeon]